MKVLLSLLIAVSFAKEEKIDECILNSKGICTVETEKITDKTVEEKTPKQFQDSGIKRKLPDGSVQEFDGDKYKIVPRTQKRKVVVKDEKKFKPVLIREKVIEKNVTHKNRLSIILGHGPNGNMDCDAIDRDLRCRTEDELNLGLQYMRDFKTRENYSIHGLIQGNTNKSMGLGIGVGF